MTLINEFVKYSDGRGFPHHLLMLSHNGTALQALKQADIWHVHNYWTHRLAAAGNRKRILAQFHSLPRLGSWKQLMSLADVCYTIKQPLHEKEYGIPGLPNVIDPDEYYPVRKGKKIRIAFAPTNRMPVGNPASKGYHAVKKVLDEIAWQRDVDIVWIEGKDYGENLRMKSGCHILIDDVVTGNWHRTSLEGACFGCAVLNKVRKLPFVFASLKTLEEQLLWLIDNRKVLEDVQERTRLWALQKWHAMDQVKKYVRAYKQVLA